MQIMRSTLMFYTGSNILMKCKVLIKSSNNDENIMTVLSCLKMQKKNIFSNIPHLKNYIENL